MASDGTGRLLASTEGKPGTEDTRQKRRTVVKEDGVSKTEGQKD